MAITLRIFGFLAAFLMLGLTSSATAAPASSQTAAAATSASTAGEYKTAAWSDRVCCHRHDNDWWTSRRSCYRAGGREVGRWQCRNERSDNVCCKLGDHAWWAFSRGSCRDQHGYTVRNEECRRDQEDDNDDNGDDNDDDDGGDDD